MSFNIIKDIDDALKKTKKEHQGENVFVKCVKFGENLIDKRKDDLEVLYNEKVKPTLENGLSYAKDKYSTIEKEFENTVISGISSTFTSSQPQPQPKPITEKDKDFLNLLYYLNQVYIKTKQYLNQSSKT